MPPAPGDAQLGPAEGRIPALAELYDKFAHSLDPLSEEGDKAEEAFIAELTALYESLPSKPEFRLFRREVIRRCKLFLQAHDKPQDQRLLRRIDKAKEP